MAPAPRSLVERIADKFLVGGDGCWPWTGSLSSRGYGRVYSGGLDGPYLLQAHRVVYELLCGPIDDGLELDHLCRNRACVRPDHMEPVSHEENVLRGLAGEANRIRWSGRTHCSRGHELTVDNVTVSSRGGAGGGRSYDKCRTCTRVNVARRRQVTVDVG